LDVLVGIELKRLVIDRIVYLLASGHVLPVLEYINSLDKIDLSLMVHFITEVCAHIAPPYSEGLVQRMIQIFGKQGVTEAIKRKMITCQAVVQFLADAQMDNEEAADLEDGAAGVGQTFSAQCLADIARLEKAFATGAAGGGRKGAKAK
jgi:hypothetical protein